MLPSDPLPLFSEKKNHQYRSVSDTACQFLPRCESFNKPLLPAGNTPAGQHTRTGKGSHNIMIVIIIIISIRLRYILKNTHKNTV